MDLSRINIAPLLDVNANLGISLEGPLRLQCNRHGVLQPIIVFTDWYKRHIKILVSACASCGERRRSLNASTNESIEDARLVSRWRGWTMLVRGARRRIVSYLNWFQLIYIIAL